MATRSDKPSTRKSASRSKAKDKDIVQVDSASQRAPNAEEVAAETLVPDVLRANLTRERIASDVDRGRWIAARAYELAQVRGFAPGGELDDWLQAEREFDERIRTLTG